MASGGAALPVTTFGQACIVDIAANHRRVAAMQRIFHRGMAIWAQEVLAMRKAGLHKINWDAASRSQFTAAFD